MNSSRSWLWLLGLYTIASFVEAAFYGQLGSFTPLYLPKLGIPPDQITLWTGIAASVAGLLGLPFLPFWGALADRYARKPIIIRSFVVHIIAGTLAILAGNIWVFLLARSFSSLALGNSGLMMTTLTERAPENRRGLAFSIMNGASPIGVFLGPLFGGPLFDRFGFRVMLGVDVVLLVGVVLSLSLGYRDTFQGGIQKPLLSMAADSLRILWRSLRLRLLFPALFVFFAGWNLALAYVPLAVGGHYHGSDLATVVGFVVGGGGLVALVVSPLLGALADRYGHWRMLFAGAILQVALFPIPALMPSLISFAIAWAALNGLSSALLAISFSVLAGSTTESVRGRVMSFSYLPVIMGGIVGPAIGSLITRQSVYTVFPAAAVLTAIGIGLLYWAYIQQK